MRKFNYQIKIITQFLNYFGIIPKFQNGTFYGIRIVKVFGTPVIKSFYLSFHFHEIYALKKADIRENKTEEFISDDIDEVINFLFPDLTRQLSVDYLLH
ncbi:MAG: hypothetical protein CMC13_09840 [Flavobacteriaceae bacterium]|nr:hypothetical protein [Flavobacteriaceae bacterium]|tara:strand:+ start:24219 stop:24515 length:297 start_codon:yes stop_codon:yes gene_type:complete